MSEQPKPIAEASTRTCMECGADIFSDKQFLTVLVPSRPIEHRLVVYGLCCQEKAKAFYKKTKKKNNKVAIGLHTRNQPPQKSNLTLP